MYDVFSTPITMFVERSSVFIDVTNSLRNGEFHINKSIKKVIDVFIDVTNSLSNGETHINKSINLRFY